MEWDVDSNSNSAGTDPVPLKTRLCMICVSPIPSGKNGETENLEMGGESHLGNRHEMFLRGMHVLCEKLRVDSRYAKEEEWATVLGTSDIVDFVCCVRCVRLLKKLVELQNVIEQTEILLNDNVKQIEATVINSFGLAAEIEYSIKACLQFREEILKNFNLDCTPKTETPQATRTKRKRCRPAPLSVKRKRRNKYSSPSSNSKTDLIQNALIQNPIVKIERLSINTPIPVPVLTRKSKSSQVVALKSRRNDSDYSDGEGSSLMEPNSPEWVMSDPENDMEVSKKKRKENDEDFRPKKYRYRGSLDKYGRRRKRGRPPTKVKEVKVKRPRGRPRRPRLPHELIKRPRGRPRRSDNIVTEDDIAGKLLEEVTQSVPKNESEDLSLDDIQLNEEQANCISFCDSGEDENESEDGGIHTKTGSVTKPKPSRKPSRKRQSVTTSEACKKAIAAATQKYAADLEEEEEEENPYSDRRVTRTDDPFNDRRSSKKVDRLLKEDSPYYLRPFLLLDAGTGMLSLLNCRILLEPDRLVCKHPNCTFDFKYEYFSTYYAFRGLRFHVKMSHRRAKKPVEDESQDYYACVYCDKLFEKRFFLVQHIKKTHENAEDFPSLCEICGKSMPHNEMLDHLFSHKNEEEKEVARLMQRTESRPGKIKDPTMPSSFPCDKCDQVFENHTRLRIHAISHVPREIRRQHQCDMCPEKLCSLNNLIQHIRTVHFKHEQPSFVCNICGRKFIKQQKQKYIIHMRSHTGELPFQCDQCGKGFRDKCALKGHEETHIDAQIPCEYCSNIYKNHKYLRRHHLKHHSDIVQAPPRSKTIKYRSIEHRPDYHGPKLMYPCEPCGRVYIFKSQLISHFKHAHKMNYPKSSDYPNMLTFEDHVEISNSRNRTPKPKSSGSPSIKGQVSSDYLTGVFGI